MVVKLKKIAAIVIAISAILAFCLVNLGYLKSEVILYVLLGTILFAFAFSKVRGFNRRVRTSVSNGVQKMQELNEARKSLHAKTQLKT